MDYALARLFHRRKHLVLPERFRIRIRKKSINTFMQNRLRIKPPFLFCCPIPVVFPAANNSRRAWGSAALRIKDVGDISPALFLPDRYRCLAAGCMRGRFEGRTEQVFAWLGCGKTKRPIFLNRPCGIVELPGLEPGKTDPETVVLPLHHSSMLSCLRVQK